MSDSSVKLSAVSTANYLASTDKLVALVANSSGGTANAAVRLTPVGTGFSNVTMSFGNVVIVFGDTPANSSITCTKGQVWFDTDFIYVATANNTLKRAALSSF